MTARLRLLFQSTVIRTAAPVALIVGLLRLEQAPIAFQIEQQVRRAAAMAMVDAFEEFEERAGQRTAIGRELP
jgi:hypothetical protein